MDFNTYKNAAIGLRNLGHTKRSEELYKHGIKRSEFDYILYPNLPAKINTIRSNSYDLGKSIYFRVWFTDINKNSKDISISYRKDAIGNESFHAGNIFANRESAVKFKKEFIKWLVENGYEKILPFFEKISINSLYRSSDELR